MDTSYAVSISGMHAAQTRQDITAHDVANINTDGFEEYSAIQEDTNPGTSIASIRKTDTYSSTAPSNTDFAIEAKEMAINKTAYTAGGKVLRVQDQMTGELLDMVG